MSGQRHYLDFNASAPLLPEARAAMLAVLDMPGNAASVHAEGRVLRGVIEAARGHVAALVGALATNVVFTSGGTEAANLALSPQVFRSGASSPLDVLLVAAGEHACVLGGHRFDVDRVIELPLLSSGVIDLDALAECLASLAGRRPMLALQLANNETGAVQPVAAAAALVRAMDGVVVCDCVQAAGKIPVDISAIGADMMVLSAHKIGGPKGVGALVFSDDSLTLRAPVLRGGSQERGLRAGTENGAAIAGFGAAAGIATLRLSPEAERLASLRNDMEVQLLDIAPHVTIFGQEASRLPNTCCFAIPGLSAETALMGLDLFGIAVSSGSACSSGKVRPSHVLRAMGVDAGLATGALRVSLGWTSCVADTAALIAGLKPIAARVNARRVNQAA